MSKDAPEITYKGVRVCHAHYDAKRQIVSLIGLDDVLVAEIPEYAFHTNPQLKKLEVHHGKHRRANPQVRGSSSGKSGRAIPLGAYYAGPLLPIRTLALNLPRRHPGYDCAVDDAGIRAGEVVAPRCWRVLGKRLFSVYMREEEWLPDAPMTFGRSTFPEFGGVHAFKREAAVELYAHDVRMNDDMMDAIALDKRSTGLAFGTVALWGQIIEHEYGYRAEFGKVKSIDRVTHMVGEMPGYVLGCLKDRYRLW